jgi:hypothetical protein
MGKSKVKRNSEGKKNGKENTVKREGNYRKATKKVEGTNIEKRTKKV